MLFSSVKGINRLISKGMSNIYLEVDIEKTDIFKISIFLNLKDLPPGQFLESPNWHRYNWIPKLLVAT